MREQCLAECVSDANISAKPPKETRRSPDAYQLAYWRSTEAGSWKWRGFRGPHRQSVHMPPPLAQPLAQPPTQARALVWRPRARPSALLQA